MTFTVLHYSKEVGRISLDTQNEISFEGRVGDQFRQFIQESVVKGITALRDLHHKNIRVKIRERVPKNHPLFGLALRQWLEYQGYEVVDLHPETDQELVELATRARNILEGVDAQELRDNKKFRDSIVSQMDEVKKALDPLVEEVGIRAINFED